MKRVEALKLRFKCDEDWSAFEASEHGPGARLCQKCVKHVRDLSTMTRSEALALFENPPPEGLCVRYRDDGQGRVLFRSERYPGYLAWKRFKPAPPARAATKRAPAEPSDDD